MLIRNEKGLTGIDIVISIIVITIFLASMANLIANISLNNKKIERESIATSYAIQEIEKIKAKGYININYDTNLSIENNGYNGAGISSEDVLEQSDIAKNGIYTGFHKKITIKDYVMIVNDNTKQSDILKQITVEIFYKVANKEEKVSISTYITK